MKIAFGSDIHLEFGTISLTNDENADVLVLAGDICAVSNVLDVNDTGNDKKNKKSKKIHTFFQECCARFPEVILVAGNHEYYNSDFHQTIGTLRKLFSYLTNLHILDCEMYTLGDVRFIGGTFWTDMDRSNPMLLMNIKKAMSDFRCIENGMRKISYVDRVAVLNEIGIPMFKEGLAVTKSVSRERNSLFTPEDSVEQHMKMKEYIRNVVDSTKVLQMNTKKLVVISHHAPSTQSIAAKYSSDPTKMNYAYCSQLDEFIHERPEIKLWIHGHTHDGFDYNIGETRVVCNPRGYHSIEMSARDFKLKYVEI